VNQAKPPHEQIDEARDSVHGHQMLMFSTGGAVQLYDPEVSRSGLHTAPVGGQDLARYFRDDPGESTYHYIEVLGRIAGRRPAANGQPAAAAPGSGGTS
jgi:hypothetical protein